MNKKIAQLENNQKPKINPGKKIIYVFKALNTDLTLYKIGKTINSTTRFNSHNSPLANDIQVLFQYETENVDQVESCVKSMIKTTKYRKYKEIYNIDLDILKNVIYRCDTSIKQVKNEIKKSSKKTSKKSNNIMLGGAKISQKDKLYILIPPT